MTHRFLAALAAALLFFSFALDGKFALDARVALGATRLPAPAAAIVAYDGGKSKVGGRKAEAAGSFTAANANFVITAPDRELAEAVLTKAEALREALAVRWLGEKLPAGVGPTVIRVKLSSTEDKGLSWVAENDSRLSHLMWLTTSRERALGTTLAHEMTHVVLATRYPGAVPAFATEGAACEQDDAERVAMRREIVAWWAQNGAWPHVAELFESRQIEPTDMAQYAHACSVAAFLLSRGGRAKFIDFAVAGQERTWPVAVREFYGFDDLMSLQSAWRDWAVASQ